MEQGNVIEYAFTYSLQNPRLSYYLEGFDKEPASVSRQELQPVSYTNLSGGKYIFHFSVCRWQMPESSD